MPGICDARGFGNVAPTKALLDLWSIAPSWRPEESIALAFGEDPSEVIMANAAGYDNPQLRIEDPGPHLLRMALRSIEEGQLRERSSPKEFLMWAERNRIWFHRDWWMSISPDEPLGPNGQHSIEFRSVRQRDDYQQVLRELIAKWGRAPSWRREEGAALSMNIAPEAAESGRFISGVVKAEYRRRADFAERAYWANELPAAPAPAVYIAWAAKSGFPFDDAWTQKIHARPLRGEVGGDNAPLAQARTTDDLQKNSEKGLGTRERDSLLKLVIGMAVGFYGYDPSKLRNDATKDIAADLERVGVPLDRDTILKWLRTGAELLPRQRDT